MAELPRTPFNTSETKPIRYNLSAADIAGPYTEIARAADKASGALSDVSVPLAEDAASKVVRRDDSGNLIVDQLPPMFGAAAKEARLTIASKLQPQIETDLLQQKLDHQYDPAGFMKSVSAYKPALLKGMDSQLGIGVDKMIDNTSQQYLRSLMIEKDNHDTSEFKENMEARLTRINDQTQVLARQEGGVESKEYSQLYQERISIINAMAANPKLKLSPDKALLLRDEAHGNDMGQSIVGSTIRQFQTKKNKVEAQRYLMDWAWGEQGKDLPLTPRQRDHFVTEGLRSLEGMSAADSKEITKSKQNINGYVTAMGKNPEAYQEDAARQLLLAARAVGDTDGESQLRSFHNLQPILAHLASQNSEDRTSKIELLKEWEKGNVPGPGPDEAFTNAPGPPRRVIDFSDAATVKIWEQSLDHERAWAGQDTQRSYDDLKHSIDTGRPVTMGQVRQFYDLAHLGRREDLVEKFRPELAVLANRGVMTREQTNAFVSAAKQRAANDPDPVAQRSVDTIVKADEADKAERDKNPMQYAVDHYGANPLTPLAPENPDAFKGAIAQRGDTAGKFHAMEKEFGGISWVNDSEADVLRGQITQTLPPKEAAAAIRTLAQIPDTDGDRLATLTQPKIMAAIIDAGNSIDPLKAEAAMQTQYELWQQHHFEYKKAYGPDAEQHLMSYQSMSAFTPEERTANLNRPVPGRDRKTRADLETVTKNGMSSLDAEDVAYMMGSASTPQFTHIGRLTGSTPEAPFDAATRSAFVTEFKEGVATIVGSGVDDVGQAKQVMAQKMALEWSRSPLNGNRLMKYAPENPNVYPTLPGDPEGHWQHDQLYEHITSLQGPEFNYAAGEQTIPNWKFQTLISDAQSKYEAEHGLPVSYQIGILDESGQAHILKDAAGAFSRFNFQPGKASDPTTPAGRAYEARRIALEKSEKHLAARAAIQQRLYGFGGGRDAEKFGSLLPSIDIPNMVRGAIGAPPLEAQSPPYNHDAHVEARDGGK